MNFEKYKDNYDYRKFFSFEYLDKFREIFYNKGESHSKMYNKTFFGKISVINSKKIGLSDKQIQKIAAKSRNQFFAIFVLSRGVYNLQKHHLQDYSKLVVEQTDPELMFYWMGFDKVYLFKMKNLKKDVKNSKIPYDSILELIDVNIMSFVFGNKFVIKLEKESSTDILVFENIIECWKFYIYGRTLYYNANEYQRSLCHEIKMNIRLLLDDYRFKNPCIMLYSS